MGAAYEAAMAEQQSHREEMSAAIRAQRERLKAAQPAKSEPPKLLSRLRGKYRSGR